MSEDKRIHDTTVGAAIRFAGGTALAFALLASLPALAGRFTEQDGSGPAFQGPMAGSITPAAAQDRTEAKAETVLSDAIDGFFKARDEREAGTPKPSPFLRMFGTR